jgi:hypothetical protein
MNPITPAQAKAQKHQVIPDYVIEAFNSCILKNIKAGGTAQFTQKEVVTEIISKAPEGTDKRSISANNWLDIELCFEAAGWRVEYDKPGYNETYDATFTFTPR